MLRASWNLACGGQLGLNRCVRFQSASRPPTIVNVATKVRIHRPLLVRFIVPGCVAASERARTRRGG
jgi:hypothetical protein